MAPKFYMTNIQNLNVVSYHFFMLRDIVGLKREGDYPSGPNLLKANVKRSFLY